VTYRIVIPIFENITALDAVGPYEVLNRLPDTEVLFCSETTGPKFTDTRTLGLMATHSLAEIDRADVLLVPGGFGTRPICEDEVWLDWVRAIDKTADWTTSVCTGSLVLGAAGLLQGLRATTHWSELDTLAAYGADPTQERVVEQGRIITAAGVSSGIDMALVLVQRLMGDEVAQAIQLAIEYDPQPPFDSGSLAKAPQSVIDLVMAVMADRKEKEAAAAAN
jgi:transcriptional regulator GlxA family with amidase domain